MNKKELNDHYSAIAYDLGMDSHPLSRPYLTKKQRDRVNDPELWEACLFHLGRLDAQETRRAGWNSVQLQAELRVDYSAQWDS